MKVGDKVVYTSAFGTLYSAFVKHAHRDGDFTIQLYFPLDDAGQEMQGCFHGTRFRVNSGQVSEWR